MLDRHTAMDFNTNYHMMLHTICKMTNFSVNITMLTDHKERTAQTTANHMIIIKPIKTRDENHDN